jgi:hypothetical protein
MEALQYPHLAVEAAQTRAYITWHRVLDLQQVGLAAAAHLMLRLQAMDQPVLAWQASRVEMHMQMEILPTRKQAEVEEALEVSDKMQKIMIQTVRPVLAVLVWSRR